MAIALPVSWAEICFWATSSLWCFSDQWLFPHCCRSYQQQSSCTQRGVSPVQTSNISLLKNKYLVPRLRRAFFRDAHNDGTTWVQNWRPERGDAARQEKLSSLTGWDTISRAETHFCSVDFVLYGSRQAHATSNSEVIWNPLHFFWWIRPDWHGP